MDVPQAQMPATRRFRTFRSISALILREMTSRYGRSPGGYFWALVEPVAGIAFLTIVFTLVMRSPPLGTNFPYFYASGIIPFGFFSGISGKMATSLTYSRALLSYPVMSFTDALVARFLLNGLTQLLVMVLITIGIIYFYDLNPVLDWPQLFLGLAMLMAITTSIGVLNCYLFNIFPVYSQVWGVMTRPLFIASGVFFIPENVPVNVREYFLYNPLAHVIAQIRKGYFASYDAPYVSPLYVFVLSMALGTIGLLLLLRNYKDILLK
jgi:capsular polysaccharide transport system permease protein